MVTDRSREAEVGCARERLVNYLMTCEEDSRGESELADATQYQTTCQEESQLPSVGTLPPRESKNWKPSHCTGTVPPQHHPSRNMPISFFNTNDWWESRLLFSFLSPPQSSTEEAWWQGVIVLIIFLFIIRWRSCNSYLQRVNLAFQTTCADCFVFLFWRQEVSVKRKGLPWLCKGGFSFLTQLEHLDKELSEPDYAVWYDNVHFIFLFLYVFWGCNPKF